MMEKKVCNRLYWVDGLKGICAVIVVLQHTLVTIFGLSVSENFRIPIIHNLWDGNFAVSAFIILSTILTCYGIEKHRKGLLKRYRYIVLKRYFRLLVPVGVIIVMMYLLNLAGLFYAEEFGAKTNNSWLMNSTETLIHLPGNILCAPLGGCYTILRVGWMLKYVFLGTMWVVILDLLLAERKNNSKLFLLAICTYIAWKCDFYYINVVSGYALYTFRDELLCGGAKKYILLLVLLLIFCVSDLYYKTDQWNMVRAICIVSLVFISNCSIKILSIKPLVWLGNISMNIYLLHMMVLYMITCRMVDMMSLSITDITLMFAVTLILTLIFAYFYTKWIERFLNNAVDKLLDRL